MDGQNYDSQDRASIAASRHKTVKMDAWRTENDFGWPILPQIICIEYEVEGSRPRGRPKRTWTEVVQKRLPSTQFQQGECYGSW